MNEGLISSIAAIVFGGGAVALFWRPVVSHLANVVTGNRATGDLITGYKDQVAQLKSDNALLREQNDELRQRHDENVIRISALETDLKVIKNALSVMLAMSEANIDERFKTTVTGLISRLGGSDDSRK
ncbi:MAG: hypothetical protein E6Z83_08025 [Pantoea sp.]|uniref:hypothetical protein n=1 Tax=Pantoea sp. TaxID=69393 RepID=UPI00290AE7DA|nr:hypothetical protein [Pantoea sp.]MDU5780743.1 hypothetical protein [Pantoea sp.]